MSVHGPFVYRTRTRRNDPGHAHFLTFSCFKRQPLLTNDEWRGWLAASIQHALTVHQIDLWAYVFMPEHVHLLIRPRQEKYSISKFLQLAKGPVATRILNRLKDTASPLLNRLRVSDDPADQSLRVWQAGGGHDLNIWSMKKAIEKAEYCHNNPVKRRLAASPAAWRWSSFRWLELAQRTGEPLSVDEWNELPDTKT